MSDNDAENKKKLEKIAAARKKLKQYQSKGPKTKENDDKTIITELPPVSIDSDQIQVESQSTLIQPLHQEPQHGNVISLQEFSSIPSEETQFTQAPTAPIESADIDPFQQFNTFNMAESFQSNSSGPSLQNYFNPAASNVVDIFGSYSTQSNYQQPNFESSIPMASYQNEYYGQNHQSTPQSLQTTTPICPTNSDNNVQSNYFDPNQHSTFFQNIPTTNNQYTNAYSQFSTLPTKNLTSNNDFNVDSPQLLNIEHNNVVVGGQLVYDSDSNRNEEKKKIVEPSKQFSGYNEGQQLPSQQFDTFQNPPGNFEDNSNNHHVSLFNAFSTPPVHYPNSSDNLYQKQNSFFDAFNKVDSQNEQSESFKNVEQNNESQNSAAAFATASFFSNTNSSSNTDSPINAFNILSLPENNSETISTISERTENESSLEKRDEDEDISNSESLNQLSAQMSSILLAEDKVVATQTENIQHQQSSDSFDFEQKIQELQLLLQTEKIRNEELNFKTANQNTTIEELRLENQKLQYEKTMNVGVNVENLQEQLQNHIKTVGILVGEKSELSASLNKTQHLIRDKSSEIDELQSRLSASRHKVQEYEKELNQSKISCDRLSQSQQKLLGEMEQFQEEINRLTTLYRDSMEDNEILNQKLSLKTKEIQEFQESLNNKTSEINMLQLRVEQLKFGETNPGDESQIVALSRQKDNYEQQIVEYQKLVEQIRIEKDQTNQHYQSYLQNLNNQTSNLASRVEELTYDKERLLKREEELVKHIGDLERNLQQQMNAKHEVIEKETEVVRDEKLEEQCKVLGERVVELERESQENLRNLQETKGYFEKLQHELHEKTEKLHHLELTVERLQSDRPDAAKILASIESEKVAASRAVSQNVELKQQLEEMQRAFVQISNDKLELTDKLQTEQHLCREMKAKYDIMESSLDDLKHKFDNKDTEMIRLALENSELNKQILQQNQELDRMRHYEAKNHLGSVLQTELQNANDQIAYLRSRIKEMENQRKLTENSEKVENAQEVVEGNVISESSASLEDNNNDKQREDNEENELLSTSNFMIASHEAMEKLQERFRRTMDEIADLTEEKQKLEHLVLQLQGETETIGEYVALYQTQRRLLKQREIEKDTELRKLADDREQMKDKLTYLNKLIEQLLHEKGLEMPVDKNLLNGHTHSDGSHSEHDHSSHGHSDGHHSHENENLLNQKSFAPSLNSLDRKRNESDVTTETAVKILNLLEEIKDVNNSMDSLQHCHCCQGQLETV